MNHQPLKVFAQLFDKSAHFLNIFTASELLSERASFNFLKSIFNGGI
jgi:hypothetical protein